MSKTRQGAPSINFAPFNLVDSKGFYLIENMLNVCILSSAFVFIIWGIAKREWRKRKMCRVQILIISFELTTDRFYIRRCWIQLHSNDWNWYERNITRKICNFMRQSTADIWRKEKLKKNMKFNLKTVYR